MKTAALILVGVITLVVFSCSNEGDGFLARLLRRGSGGVPVTVESVVVQDRAKEISVPAAIEAVETVDATLSQDVIVERVLAAEGGTVSAGDLLARLSESDLAARTAKLRADAKETQASIDKDTYLLKNRERLLAEGRIDQTQHDGLEAELARGEAALEKVNQDIARMEELAAQPVVASPASGTILAVHAATGVTAQGGKPLFTISRGEGVSASFRLPPEEKVPLQEGQLLRATSSEPGGEALSVRVASVVTDAEGRSVKVSLPGGKESSRYRSGGRLQIFLPGAERSRVFIIPEDALIRERGAVFVYIVEKKAARKVQVIPSETIGNRVEILRGLDEGALVVVRGQDRLSEGTAVDIWKGR